MARILEMFSAMKTTNQETTVALSLDDIELVLPAKPAKRRFVDLNKGRDADRRAFYAMTASESRRGAK